MWEKRATSAEGKTIRIAESSDMDSWNELLGPMCKFWKQFEIFERENEVEYVLCNYASGQA